MLNHYRNYLRHLPFAGTVVVSWVILFTPESGVPTAPPGTDKVVHLLLFAALAGTGRLARLPAAPLLVGLVGYAALSEVLQELLPIGRSGDWVDALVDIIGAGLGWAFTTELAGKLRRDRRTTG